MYFAKQVTATVLIYLLSATLTPAQHHENETNNFRKIGLLGKFLSVPAKILFVITIFYSIIAYAKQFLKFDFYRIIRWYRLSQLPTKRKRNWQKEIGDLQSFERTVNVLAMETKDLISLFEWLYLMPGKNDYRDLLLTRVIPELKRRRYPVAKARRTHLLNDRTGR